VGSKGVSFFDVGASPGALWSSNGGGGKGSMFDFLGGFPDGIIGRGSGGEILEIVLEL
jgi:hypothetical protein